MFVVSCYINHLRLTLTFLAHCLFPHCHSKLSLRLRLPLFLSGVRLDYLHL